MTYWWMRLSYHAMCIITLWESLVFSTYQKLWWTVKWSIKREILIKYLCLYSCRVWLQLKVWRAMMPSCHVLGALLLEQLRQSYWNRIVYREDLKQYKNNMWSLVGLSQASKQQLKLEEANVTCDLFDKTSVHTDVNIQASCLCATKYVFIKNWCLLYSCHKYTQ